LALDGTIVSVVLPCVPNKHTYYYYYYSIRLSLRVAS